MRVQRFCRTKYCSVVALPSLTSCVHCSSGILMPNVLSIANAMSRKSRLSMPRSLMAWLSGLIVSRGISQVSVMILTTVSKVDDIGESLDGQRGFDEHTEPAAISDAGPRGADPPLTSTARIANGTGEFNAA